MGEEALEYKPVAALSPAHQDNLLDLRVEGETTPLRPTASHPFWGKRGDADGHWMAAGTMRGGDLLLTTKGDWKRVVALTPEKGVQSVYNFTVDKDHDYFVGQTGFLVHNEPPCNCKFGTAPFGNEMHETDYFGPALADQTGTAPSVWNIDPP